MQDCRIKSTQYYGHFLSVVNTCWLFAHLSVNVGRLVNLLTFFCGLIFKLFVALVTPASKRHLKVRDFALARLTRVPRCQRVSFACS